jgi:prepilin-type N-terminal cleavage/methylation domain-containing protein
MFLQKFHKNHRGFSLVELIVVVAIVAILGAIGIPSYMRRQKAARRSECTTMLSTLSTMQASYATQEGYTMNRIFCPRNDDGLHIINFGGNSKNVLTMLDVEAERFCGRNTQNIRGEAYPVPLAGSNKIAYGFRFKAARWDQENPTTIASGGAFPNLASGTNVHGFKHAGNGPAIGTFAASTGVINPTDISKQFIVQCAGNVDDDNVLDIIATDHLGNTQVIRDDVKVD